MSAVKVLRLGSWIVVTFVPFVIVACVRFLLIPPIVLELLFEMLLIFEFLFLFFLLKFYLLVVIVGAFVFLVDCDLSIPFNLLSIVLRACCGIDCFGCASFFVVLY